MSYLKIKNKFISIAGKETAYRELGKGKSKLPLVMLVHLAATMDDWDPKLLDLLAEQQHIILLDLPGVGASQGKVATTISGMAVQATATIKELGYEKINLLGLSMGGMIAQEIVRADNTLVNRLILVGTGPRAGRGIANVIPVTFKYILKAAVHRMDPKRYIFFNPDAEGKGEADRVLNRLASRSEEMADKPMAVPGFLRQLRAIRHWGKAETEDLTYITQPTLIVNGDNDTMVLTENSYDMHRKIDNSKLIIYPNAGHGSLFQYAAQFADDLLLFLGE